MLSTNDIIAVVFGISSTVIGVAAVAFTRHRARKDDLEHGSASDLPQQDNIPEDGDVGGDDGILLNVVPLEEV